MDGVENRARQLLRQLDTEPRGPSRVDLARIVADGRRRLRVRAMALGSGVAAAALLLASVGVVALIRQAGPAPSVAILDTPPPSPAPTQPAAPTGCVGQLLPSPSGSREVTVLGTDPTGRYVVGRSVDKVGRYRPLLWTDGALTVLDRQGSDGEVDGMAVTASGTVVWSSSAASPTGYRENIWRYEDGKLTRLDRGAGYRVMAVDDDGTVLALDQSTSTGPKVEPRVRLLALPADGRPERVRDLQALDTVGRARVVAVDGAGTAVGIADDATGVPGLGPARAVAWPADGPMRSLPAPDDPSVSTWAGAVSGDWVVGMAGDVKSRPIRAVRWDLRTGAGQWVDQLSRATAVNRYGWLAGTDPRQRPVLLVGDQAVPLPVPPGATDGKGLAPTTVSDNGRTVAGLAAVGGTLSAVRWSCQ
jgi:hypothetical protein